MRNFIIVALIISSGILFAVITLSNSKSIEKNIDYNLPNTTNTDDWVTYQLPEINMEIQLPLELNPTKEFTFTKSHNNLWWNDYQDAKIALHATSINSTFEGADSYLAESLGYKKIGNSYKYLRSNNRDIELPTKLVYEKTNSNQINYLVVKSDPTIIEEGMPGPGMSKKGYISAIITTGNSDYPALVIEMKTSNTATEENFNKILDTLKKVLK